MMTLLVGAATVERSFSHMKMIKSHLRNQLSDENLDDFGEFHSKDLNRNSLILMQYWTIKKNKNN